MPEPLSPAALAARIADAADAAAAALQDRAVPVARVHAEEFLRARSLRLERGPADPDAFFEGWYDPAAPRREVLDPLGPGGSQHWLPGLRDPRTDRPLRRAAVAAPAGTVAVVDGLFLGRWDVADAVDVRVFLDVSPAARARRIPADEQARVLPAWERYLEWCDPAARAIDPGGGSISSPDAGSASNSSRVHQRACASSTPSTSTAVPTACPRNPSISDDGKGQGWLPRYSTSPTTTPASSATSRRTAASSDSPGSTKPASVEYRFGGHAACRPRSR